MSFKQNYDLFCATHTFPKEGESLGTLVEDKVASFADWVAHNNLPTERIDRAAFFAAVGQEVLSGLEEALVAYREDYEASREEEKAARHWNPNKEEIH